MKKAEPIKESKPLVVIITNPPTKEQAKQMILKISKEINELYSQKLIMGDTS